MFHIYSLIGIVARSLLEYITRGFRCVHYYDLGAKKAKVDCKGLSEDCLSESMCKRLRVARRPSSASYVYASHGHISHRTIDRYVILSTVWRHMYHTMMFHLYTDSTRGPDRSIRGPDPHVYILAEYRSNITSSTSS